MLRQPWQLWQPIMATLATSYNLATFCLPIYGERDMAEFIEWYAHQVDNYIQDASPGFSNQSLFYGTVD